MEIILIVLHYSALNSDQFYL